MRNEKARVSRPNDFVSCSGSPIHEIRSPKMSSDGSLQLVISGKENIQDKINSYVPSTDFAYILNQLSFGDQSVISQGQMFYGDFTQVPKTMADAMQLQLDAEAAFYKLPLDLRNQFDNDVRRWLASAGSADWLLKMGIISEDDMRSMNNSQASPPSSADQPASSVEGSDSK